MPIDVITNNTTVQNASADNQYSGTESLIIRESDPTSNFSSGYNSDIMEVTRFNFNDRNDALLRFTGLSNISSSATVTSATLYIYQTGNNASYSVDLFRCLRPWVEGQATWNIYSTGNSWSTAGANGSGTDVSSTAESSTSIGTSNGTYYALDCTSLVQDIIDGTISSDEGFVLRPTPTPATSTFKVFSSSRGTDGQRPELVVNYTTSGGSTDTLLADDVSSASSVGSPTIGQTHELTVSSVSSSSELSTPSLAEIQGLLADDIESSSQVSSPVVGQTHSLSVTAIQSVSEVSSPVLGQTHNILSVSVESTNFS